MLRAHPQRAAHWITRRLSFALKFAPGFALKFKPTLAPARRTLSLAGLVGYVDAVDRFDDVGNRVSGKVIPEHVQADLAARLVEGPDRPRAVA